MKTNEQILREIQAAKYKTNNVLHFIISLITAGLWIPVWFLVAQRNASKRASIINETSTFSKVFIILVAVAAVFIFIGIML